MEDTQEITLAGGASEAVTFTIAKDVAGTYSVILDGLSGTFVVKGTADFGVSELAITPAEVATGEGVTIKALVTNRGDVAGSYKVTLRIDNEVAASAVVTLPGGASEEVIFTIAKDVAGSYAVAVDGLAGTFVVRTPPEPVKWWLPGGIIAAAIALVVFIWLAVIRRQRA
ncbi:MAG: hypothetical protein HYU85_01320 [Chloroflexi bacterium]|nr:hypothetical protein [Chloroflexota bacterium]